MSTYLLLAILRSGLHDLAQRFRCPPKNKLRLKPLGSGQKLSQLGNPGRIFQGEKRSPGGPGRIEGLEVAQPVRHLGLALHHVADKLRETFCESTLHPLRIPDKMPDTQRRKGFAFIPMHQAVKPAGAFVDRKSTRLNSSHVRTSYAVF